jgi:hypothetical protein
MPELQCWNKIGSSDFAKKFAGLTVVVIDDNRKWQEIYGSNDSKSSYSLKTIILKKEVFDREDIPDENLSWLVHEMGHIDFYDGLGDGLDAYMKEYYAAGKYTESEMEQKAFELQFKFLKSIGKTEEECLGMMEKYLAKSFQEDQKNERKQEFEQIRKYVENVYADTGEEGLVDKPLDQAKLVSESEDIQRLALIRKKIKNGN